VFLFVPIDAVSRGENDGVGDQRAAAESESVQDETDLIGELAAAGDVAADDLAVGGTGT
jgi:hypothetical protein